MTTHINSLILKDNVKIVRKAFLGANEEIGF